jgi:N-acetylmuramoyl-L-alanine amidase
MIIADHYLRGGQVVQRASPNQGGPYQGPYPDTVVIHYTAGANAESAIRTLSDPERRVSAHLVLARDGAVTQLVPFDTIAWHAGQSRWGDREALNQYSIGIEIDNAGQLEEQDGRLVSWFGRDCPEEEVVWGVHRNQTQLSPWHSFTDVQVRVVEQICRLLISAYDIHHILGHEEIAPQRKIDPGPAFPLDTLRGSLLYPADALGAGPRARVTANRLQIRAEPDGKAPRVAGHLLADTELQVLETRGRWCRVSAALEGWVPSTHLEEIDDGAGT